VFRYGLDVGGVPPTKTPGLREWWEGAGIASAALVASLWFAPAGDWQGLDRSAVVALIASGVWFLEGVRLRRLFARRTRDLEQHARAVGLKPVGSDARVHEGVGEHGRVRVSLEEPLMLVVWVRSVLYVFLLALAMQTFGIFALAAVVSLPVLLSAWTSRRPIINVEFVTETGSLHRLEVHRSVDVRPALAPMPRPGFAGEGALGFGESDDPAGRIGIAPKAGSLSAPEGED